MESQYKDEGAPLTTLQQSKNMYEQSKIPLPTPDKLPKIKEVESLLGALSVYFFYQIKCFIV